MPASPIWVSPSAPVWAREPLAVAALTFTSPPALVLLAAGLGDVAASAPVPLPPPVPWD
ncbi:hypothetical protein [Streptomyces sp. NPDC051572]|uniref:hypothetical protein n=1 Tax=Streptomyces sp. NPDC051572 TaxID=3155802 RepID=UPI00344E28AE